MLLQAINLTQIYPNTKKNVILKQVSLEVKKGGIYLILGPSGSGKTTLLNCIAGMHDPTSGIINYRFNDQEINIFDKKNQAQNHVLKKWFIGYLQQNIKDNLILDLNLIDYLEVLKNFDLISYDLPQVDELLVKSGLSKEHKYTKIKNFSKGEQQRISIVILLIKQPQILIFDEPTSYLDESNRDKIIQLILEYNKLGITFIITSHDVEFIKYCSNIFYLNDGKLDSEDFHHALSKTYYLNELSIKGETPDLSYVLKIPDVIFQQIAKGRAYIMEEESFGFILKIVDSSIFKKQNVDKWIYLDHSNFEIPKMFQKPLWMESTIEWTISDNKLEIHILKN